MNHWQTLNLEPSLNKREIKKAYVFLLKKTNPEEDAIAYQELREAYELALEEVEYRLHQSTQAVENDEKKLAFVETNVDSNALDDHQSSPLIENKFKQDNVTSNNHLKEEVDFLFDNLNFDDSSQSYDSFMKLINNNEFQSLDRQYQLEGLILINLCTKKPIYFDFLLKINDHFKWDSGHNPFKYDLDYKEYFYFFSHLYRQAKIKMMLIRKFRHFTHEEWNRYLPILLGETNEDELKKLYESDERSNFDAMVNQMTNQQIILRTGYINTLVLDWWLIKSGKNSPFSDNNANQLAHQQERPKPNPKHGSNMYIDNSRKYQKSRTASFTAVIFIALIFAFFATFVVKRNYPKGIFDSSNAHTPRQTNNSEPHKDFGTRKESVDKFLESINPKAKRYGNNYLLENNKTENEKKPKKSNPSGYRYRKRSIDANPFDQYNRYPK